MKSRGYKLEPSTIKRAISPYNFYLREQNLCRFGYRSGPWAIAGLCPFHEDKKQGSFKINMITGAFRCWSCGACGGDVISYLQKRDDLEFVDTLRKLCDEWGVPC